MTDRIDDPRTGAVPDHNGSADPDRRGGTDVSLAGDDDPVDPVDALDWFDREMSPDALVEPSEPDGSDPAPDRVVYVSDDDTEPDAARPGPSRGLFARAGRRVVRRPREWAARPWPTARVVKFAVTVFSLVVTTAVMMNVVHLSPFPVKDLVFDDTTPTGGDFGAHVWGPSYLRDTLLPSFRLNGWTMDWYGGMPAYRFYMVLPAIGIVALDTFLAYGVAMKVVSVLGLITLPAACWAFGRLAAFRYPMPELFAFAGLAFALDESFSIYGGNLKSTMAGEFSFSIALSLGVLAIGVLAAGLRTGKYRVWASVLIAAACVSHGIVLIFVVVAAVVFSLVWIDRTRLWYSLTVGITSVLLLMWWAGPFLLDHAFMTDMKYGARPSGADDSFWDMFFPLTAPLDILITSLAIFGFAMCIVRRHLNGAALGVVGLVFVAGVYLTRDSLPVIGLLWNPRLLPFVYLVRYLLMMVGIVELLGLFWNLIRERKAIEPTSYRAGTVIAGLTSVVVLVILGFMFQVLPGGGTRVHNDATVYAWGPITATSTNADAQGDGWARYNFLGYEGRNEYYTEYSQVVTTMADIGDDPARGCGRALWENSGDNGNYGTTMALMLLPHWTDGCIGSMEGLFFEASGTTPYHFLTTAAMSKQSSNPVRELRYVDNDASVGVRHLQDLGVRYVMVRTPEAQAEAAVQDDLELIAESAPWQIYQVADSDIVVPLDTQPVVVQGRSGDARERNLELGTSWFQQPDEWVAMPADDGPAEWQRVSVEPDLDRREGTPGESGRRVDIVVPTEPVQAVDLPEVTVSNVVIDDQSLSFDVDQVGVPVLVRVSYFPNWEASGAEGPYRVGANMMAVVPTAERVELSYGRSGVDYLTMLLTLAGIALCVLWRIRGDVRHYGEVPAGWARPTGQPVADPSDVAHAGANSDVDHRGDVFVDDRVPSGDDTAGFTRPVSDDHTTTTDIHDDSASTAEIQSEPPPSSR